MAEHSWVLPTIVLLPLLAVPFATVLAGNRFLQGWLVLSVLETAALLGLWLVYLASGGQSVSLVIASTTIVGMQVDLRLAADSLTALLLLAVVLVGLASAVFSASRAQTADADRYQPPLTLLATGILAGAIVSGNLLTFYIFWQLSILCFAMVVAVGLGARALSAATRFVVIAEAGALALLFAVGLAYTHGPDESLTGWLAMGDEQFRLAMLVLLATAAAVSVATVPLHTWFAEAGQAVEPAFAPFLYGVQNKLGLYLLARVFVEAVQQGQAAAWAAPLAVLGALTILVAGANALAQREVRRVFVFLAIAQSGYVILGLGTGEALGLAGALFHLFGQTLAIALVVLSVALVRESVGTDEPARLGGLVGQLPIAALGFVVGALSLIGVPPWSGFVGQILIYRGLAASGEPLGLVLVGAGLIGSVLAMATLAWLGGRLFLGERPEQLPLAVQPDAFARASVVGLTLACAAVGVLPRLVLDPIVSPIAGVVAVGSWADLALVPATGAAPVALWNPLLVGVFLVMLLAAFALARQVLRVRPYVRPSTAGSDVGALVRSLTPQDEGTSIELGEPILAVRWWRRWHEWTSEGHLDVFRHAYRLVALLSQLIARLARLTFRLLLR